MKILLPVHEGKEWNGEVCSGKMKNNLNIQVNRLRQHITQTPVHTVSGHTHHSHRPVGHFHNQRDVKINASHKITAFVRNGEINVATRNKMYLQYRNLTKTSAGGHVYKLAQPFIK